MVIRFIDRLRLRLSWRGILAIAICWWTAPAAADPPPPDGRTRVAILCSPYRSYAQAASALRETLEHQGHECIFIELPQSGDESARKKALERLAEAQAAVIATSGATATSLALKAVPDTPVVFFMVHNALDAGFMAEDSPDRARVTGVAADISPKEWIDWIVQLDASGRNIGVLRSPRTGRTIAALEQAARERGVTISAVDVEGNEFFKAIDALREKRSSSVLMTLDPTVFNGATVEELLVWGIRQKKPIWAFSASTVKAGALAGQYADGQAVGQQAAELIQIVIDGASPSELGLQYPRGVTKAVNERTARMIGVELNDDVIDAKAIRFGEKP